MAGQNQPAQQTPIQEWLSKNGLINPAQQYTAEDLPADVNVDFAGMEGGRAAQNAVNAAESTGAHIKRLNDERRGLQDKATVNNLTRQAQLAFLQDATDKFVGGASRGATGATSWNTLPPEAGGSRAGRPQPKPGMPTGGISYDADTGKPIYADSGPGADRQIYAPRKAMDTGRGGGLIGAMTRPIKDAIAQRANPGGDAARMAMLKRSAAAQERRKANLMASARSAPVYDQAVRQLAAQQVQQSGRTPARDAQRVLLNYMRQSYGG
jgi:hypothetical protein